METPVKAGFGRLFLAFVCSPLYFLLRGKLFAAAAHAVLYALALLLLIFGVGIFFWAAGVVHAVWDFAHVKQEQVIQRQATVMAERMAEKLSKQS